AVASSVIMVMRSSGCSRRQTRMALRAPGANSASIVSVKNRSGIKFLNCPGIGAVQPDSLLKMSARTGPAAQPSNAFADDDGDHTKGGNRIGPPPAQDGIEGKTQK